MAHDKKNTTEARLARMFARLQTLVTNTNDKQEAVGLLPDALLKACRDTGYHPQTLGDSLYLWDATDRIYTRLQAHTLASYVLALGGAVGGSKASMRWNTKDNTGKIVQHDKPLPILGKTPETVAHALLARPDACTATTGDLLGHGDTVIQWDHTRKAYTLHDRNPDVLVTVAYPTSTMDFREALAAPNPLEALVAVRPPGIFGHIVNVFSSVDQDDPETYTHATNLAYLYMADLGGYLVGAGDRVQRAWCIHGASGSGKSVILQLADKLFSPLDAVSSVPPSAMGDQFRRVALASSRLNAVYEVSEAEFQEAAYLKMVVSCEPMDAARKHRDGVIIRPRCLNLFTTNHLPRYFEPALARRFRFVFAGGQAVANPDTEFASKLWAAEGEAFLLACLLAWRAYNTVPELASIWEACGAKGTRQAVDGANPVAALLAEAGIEPADRATGVKVTLRAIVDWLRAKGVKHNETAIENYLIRFTRDRVTVRTETGTYTKVPAYILSARLPSTGSAFEAAAPGIDLG